MKNTKRIFALLLALLMVLPLMVACQDKNKDEQNNASTTIATQGAGKSPREEVKDDLPSDLNFGGEEVKILWMAYNWGAWNAQAYETLGEIEGDTVSQAVYLRNDSVSKRLNITLNFEQSVATTKNDYVKSLDSMFISGDIDADIVYHRIAEALEDANSGYVAEVTDLPYVNYDKPYWFKNQMESIAVNSKHFYVLAGDANMYNYANMTCLLYNKDLYNNTFSNQGRNTDELYAFVKDGTWTWEKYFNIVSEVYSDEDGNGFKTVGDIFGAHSESGRVTIYLPYSSGVEFVTRDDEGYPVLNFNNSTTVSMIEDLYEFTYENQGVMNLNQEEIDTEFVAKHVMFYSTFLVKAAEVMAKGADFEYGILPSPKYSENLDYSSMILTSTSSYVIPKTVTQEKLDIVGATLEALNSENYRKVSGDFYEIVLQTKYSSAEDDAEMIDVIRNSLRTDLAYIQSTALGKTMGLFGTIIFNNNSKDFVSFWEKNGSTYQAKLDALIASVNAA